MKPLFYDAFPGCRSAGDHGGLVYEVNVEGARKAAHAALRAGVRRFVQFSSIHAFDMHAAGGLVDESCRRATAERCAAYDRSKALGEAAVRDAIGLGLDAVIVHPTGVLGPGDFIPSKAGKGLLDAARGRLPVIVDGGFDWVDVRDVVSGAREAASRGKSGQSYILSGSYQTVDQLTRYAARAAGAPAPLVSLPRWLAHSFAPLPTLVGRLRGREPMFTAESLETLGTAARFSHRRATEELDYRPRHIEETISDLVGWFLDTGRLKRIAEPVSLPSPGSFPTAFACHLRAHPIDGPRERETLGLLLTELARADGELDGNERMFLTQFAEVGPEELPSRSDISTATLGELMPGVRESFLLVAVALACVDDDYSAVEDRAIEHLRSQLAIPPARSDELQRWAMEFVLDQRFDEFYADGIIDSTEVERIRQMAEGFDISSATLEEIDQRARRRRGLRTTDG
jgi:dihydroflavonol-4-reductase